MCTTHTSLHTQYRCIHTPSSHVHTHHSDIGTNAATWPHACTHTHPCVALRRGSLPWHLSSPFLGCACDISRSGFVLTPAWPLPASQLRKSIESGERSWGWQQESLSREHQVLPTQTQATLTYLTQPSETSVHPPVGPSSEPCGDCRAGSASSPIPL